MKNFQLIKASTRESAIAAIAKDTTATFIAGGTNLVDLMKKRVAEPDRLIDITAIDLQKVELKDGMIRIGALAKNSSVAQDKAVMQKQPLLALALAAGASQQIRNMATVGGNMMQRTRCPYFYNPDMPCNKREPKSGCGAKQGFNRMHAIFGASESCIAVHPSDMCIALAALDAVVYAEGPKGERKILFGEFHRLPGDTPQKDNTLERDELITAIEIPSNKFGENVHYLKVRDRTSYAFAIVSVAVALEIDKGIIRDSRLALGGVAHKPWRLFEVEKYLVGKPATAETFQAAAALSVQGAQGFGHNDFKLKLTPNAVAEALLTAASK